MTKRDLIIYVSILILFLFFAILKTNNIIIVLTLLICIAFTIYKYIHDNKKINTKKKK